ncbi:MAG TPA: tRNA (adenosine(37)-N6)-threonylcarbamoyltransferase complex dimerization subunit type 1 TsaB [Limnobacter sp.]|nr:tRNA (adenosine(37)-N6)-threonylcarbamoyltransferase complex dimerization subunit type 1 TsaB [Limnobacter sp.]
MSGITSQTSPCVLAITTSAGVAHVAASTAEGVVLFEYSIHDYKTQSLALLPMLQQHMAQADVQVDQIQAIAADIGPGGFTSLRTTCGVVQGLATAWGVPVAPISSFECLAAHAQSKQVPTAHGIRCLLDARLGELYCATLRLGTHGTVWLREPFLVSIEDAWKNPWNDGECELPTAMTDAVADLLPAPWPPGTWIGPISAVALAAMGWQAVHNRVTVEPLACQPMYVRDKVAQTTAERVAGKHGRV